jgi:DNA-binding response OmpR family regulator
MKKILIADPDKVLGSIYSEELAEEGYQVTMCSDPAELMNVIVTERPDLILIDTRMVLYPGQGFHREIENHLSVVPLVLYTSSLRPKPKKWAIPSESFVRKTRDLNPLKTKIRAVLSGRPMKEMQRVRIPRDQMAFRWLNSRKSVNQ